MTEESLDLHSVTIKGRVMQVKRPTSLQLSLMGREALRLQRVTDLKEVEPAQIQRLVKSIGAIFDLMEGTLASEDDKEFLKDLVYAGELDLGDMLTPIMAAFKPDSTESAAPVVRRGRPKRS